MQDSGPGINVGSTESSGYPQSKPMWDVGVYVAVHLNPYKTGDPPPLLEHTLLKQGFTGVQKGRFTCACGNRKNRDSTWVEFWSTHSSDV